MRPVIVSACLLGLPARYDGAAKRMCSTLPPDVVPIPVCPEILGGLPVPRLRAFIVNGTGADVLAGTATVVNAAGRDVTDNFRRGAQLALEIARIVSAAEAYLKAGSPSCDARGGVAAALLARSGLRVYDVE